MQLIAAAENERRGLYGGAVGYLGYDGNLDTAITIRSAVLRDGIAHVHTGAGIVAGSVPEREFEETEHKAAALRRAIDLASGGPRAAPMILVIDNYDSFTFNLVQALQAAGAEVRVVRNDAIDRAGLEALAGRSGRRPARDRDLTGSGRPVGRRRLGGRRPGRRRARDPAARRVPRDAVDGRRLRRLDRARPDPRPRRGIGGQPRRGAAC